MDTNKLLQQQESELRKVPVNRGPEDSEYNKTTVMNTNISGGDNNNNYQKQNIENLIEEEGQNDIYLETSIFTNPNISTCGKYGVPFVICCILALFLSSNLSTIGGITYQLHISILETEEVPIQEYSLIDTVKSQWDAQVYPLAIMIMLFSGIWPFFKLVSMIVVWFIPTTYISYKKREWILIVLDALGKWSFFDCFLMIFMINALYFTIDLPIPYLPIEIQFCMQVKYGYYSFVIATLLSLVITHVELYYHRQTITETNIKFGMKSLHLATKNKSFLNDQNQSLKESLVNNMEHEVQVVDNNIIQLYNSNGIKYFYLSLLGISFVLLAAGVAIKCMTVEIEGALGYLLDVDDVKLSVWSLGTGVSSRIQAPGFESFFLSAYFMLINIFIPGIFLLLLAILFIFNDKFTIKQSLAIFVWIEICFAWSTVDVCIVVVLMSIIELPDFVKFLVGAKCEGLNQVIEYLNDTGVLPDMPGGNVCFNAKASADNGFILLVVSGVIFNILGTWILRRIQKKIDKKLAYDELKQEEKDLKLQQSIAQDFH